MLFRILVLIPLCLAIVLTAETARSGDKKEQAKFEGTWSLVKIMGGKSPRDKDAKVTFKGNKVTYRTGDRTEESTWSVDPTKKPKEITVHMEQDGKKMTFLGIYEFAGDTLKLCHLDKKSTEGRPKELVANDETVLVVLKRDKK